MDKGRYQASRHYAKKAKSMGLIKGDETLSLSDIKKLKPLSARG